MAVLPGATIGILGGGQLGRMTAMAARRLGYGIRVLDPDPACPSRFLAEHTITAPFDDADAAVELAKGCSVLTIEIEKVGVNAMRAAAEIVPVRPGPEVLRIVQDRGVQKDWLAEGGFPVGPYVCVDSAADVAAAAAALGAPLFVKVRRGGYDGRGQAVLGNPLDTDAVWNYLGGLPAVAEQGLTLAGELSVMVARNPAGETQVYPPAFNHHVDRVLDWSMLPGPVSPAVARDAIDIARGIADRIGLEGVLCVELFITADERLYVNELAPRPHNTFHTTLEGSITSQFEQHVRAVCDLPLGAPDSLRPAAMVNLLGDLWGPAGVRWERALAIPGVHLHLYGKVQARPGRKMGHLTATAPTAEDALSRVRRARDALGG